jgi:hypothetical protein
METPCEIIHPAFSHAVVSLATRHSSYWLNNAAIKLLSDISHRHFTIEESGD